MIEISRNLAPIPSSSLSHLFFAWDLICTSHRISLLLIVESNLGLASDLLSSGLVSLLNIGSDSRTARVTV